MAPVFEKCNVALLSHVPVGLALCVTRISPRSVPVRTSALDQPQSPDQGFTPLPLRARLPAGRGRFAEGGLPCYWIREPLR